MNEIVKLNIEYITTIDPEEYDPVFEVWHCKFCHANARYSDNTFKHTEICPVYKVEKALGIKHDG